jgi:hypothetical protein
MIFFLQLDDRRVVLEKKSAALKVQYQQLKEKYDWEKQQSNKYKVSVSSLESGPPVAQVSRPCFFSVL